MNPIYQIRIEKLCQVCSQAERNSGSLDQALKIEIEGTEFLSENAEELALLLRQIVGVLTTHLTYKLWPDIINLRGKLPNPEDEKAKTSWVEKFDKLERRVSAVSDITSALVEILEYIHGSKAGNNPWGVVAQIDRLCRSLYTPSRVIVRPNWVYNYSYTSITQLLYQLSKIAATADSSLHKAIADLLFPEEIFDALIFSSLTYPPISEKNILHMSMWGHEIGHFIDNAEGIKRNYNQDGFDFDTFLSADRVEEIGIDIEPIMDKLKNIVGISGSEEGQDSESEENRDSLKESGLISKKIISPIRRIQDGWAKQIFADLFSVRMFGPAALLSLIEFDKPLDLWIDLTGPNRISLRFRLQYMSIAYDTWFADLINGGEFLAHRDSMESLNAELDYLRDLAYSKESKTVLTDTIDDVFFYMVDIDFFREIFPIFIERMRELVDVLIQDVQAIYERNPDCFLSIDDFRRIFDGATDIMNEIPAEFVRNDDQNQVMELSGVQNRIIPLVVNAGWLRWLNIRNSGSKIRNESQNRYSQVEAFEDLNVLLLKSIENAEAQSWFLERRELSKNKTASFNRSAMDDRSIGYEKRPESERSLGILSGQDIGYRLAASDLVVRPLLDEASQIGTSSIDFRLGNTFAITKQPLIHKLDPVEYDISSKMDLFQEKIHLPFGRPFILHPTQLVLATTLEYISMPMDLMGLVLDRESWGRLGLVMATRFKIIPGYRGCITLSLTNVGNAPIALYPFARICQIIFFPA